MGPSFIKIAFFLAINIIPVDQTVFTIMNPKGEAFTFTKQEVVGWKPSPAPKGGDGVWSVTGNTLKIARPSSKSGLSMNQFFTDLDAVDWKTVTQLSYGKIPLKFIREETKVSIVRGPIQKAYTWTISWTPKEE